MNPCAMHGCHGRLKLQRLGHWLGLDSAFWRCADCGTEHVQPITVVASTTSGHGRVGRARF